MSKQDPAAITRWHEAGHAVIARALGIPVAGVTARPSRKNQGCIFVDGKSWGVGDQQFHEGMIKVLLAGTLAVGRQFPHLDFESDIMDHGDVWQAYGHAHKLALLLGLPQPERLNIAHVYPATEKLVDDLTAETEALISISVNWSAIGRVARALHCNEFLKPAQLDAIVRN
jgi:hypothetical protein